MKNHVLKTLSLVVMALAATLISSCDLLDKAKNVNFDTTLEEDINIAEESAGTNKVYSQTLVIDATSDPDIAQYKNKITGFTVKKISYQVIGFDGTGGATFSGTLSFGDASSGTPTVAATITNLNFQTAHTSGTIFDLPISQADVDKVANLLKDDKAVKIYLNGTLSVTPLYSDVRIILDVSVKADAL